MSRTRSVLATLLVACVLGACSDDDPKPDIEDPTPSAASSSAGVSTSPTTSPSVRLTPDETVKAWVNAWNAALQSGDTGPLAEHETSDCRNCADLARVIEDVVAAGGSFSGGEWTIVSTKTIRVSDKRVKVNVALSVAAGSTINSAGEDPVTYEADKRIAVYELEERSGIWLIDAIELLS